MNNWLQVLSRIINNGDTAMLVTIIDTKGSAPRETSTRMILTNEHVYGTIGGGNLEYQCIDIAKQRLAVTAEQTWESYERNFPLAASLAQCCGGSVRVFFEVIDQTAQTWIKPLEQLLYNKNPTVVVTAISAQGRDKLVLSQHIKQLSSHVDRFTAHCIQLADHLFQSAGNNTITRFTWGVEKTDYLVELINPTNFPIMLFGAGHVGQAFISVMSSVDCDIHWVDSREKQFPDMIPANTKTTYEDSPEDAVNSAPSGTYFLIMTHSHQLDLRLCEAILSRSDFSYCGLIGSKSKRLRFERKLIEKSVSLNSIDKLTSPIGLGEITSKSPAEIAIGVAAELLQLKSSNEALKEKHAKDNQVEQTVNNEAS